MNSEKLFSEIECARHTGPVVEVTGVEYDSRRAAAGSLFVAMQGGTTDGNRYVMDAIRKEATAVVTDSPAVFDEVQVAHPEVALALVGHGRRALAGLSAAFFDHPERALTLSGVTGTNGKTTTAFLLDAMLNHAGRTTVLVGTIEYHVAGAVRSSPHTTPESRDLLALLAEGRSAAASECVMEVSSHALAQGRVFGLPFDVAIFTNLTRDHLDFHRTMEDYFRAKRALFDGANGRAPRVAVVNIDDAHGAELALAAREAGAEIHSYGLDVGEYRAESVHMRANGMSFHLVTPSGAVPIHTKLTGRVNIYNLLAASAAALARGLSVDEVAAGAAALACVPGRFETVDVGQPFTVVVDYAHTDDALRNLVQLAREFVRSHNGRVITLFGCGGDRDRTKRPRMGQIAGEGSDFVVLTSDNPRSEDPLAILADILPGLTANPVSYTVEPDRRKAIALALASAGPGDIVLLAGKGHEKVQITREGTAPFDDAAVARAALQKEATRWS